VKCNEFNVLLKEHQWISKLMVADACSDKGARYKVGINPEGHRFMCEFGIQEFSQRLLAELLPADQQEGCLEFLHDHDWILDGIQTGGANSKPGIVSWIQGLSEHRLLLDISPELVFFEGHFPGNPILPGIVQLHWAAGISMNLFNFDQIPCEVKRLKFSNIVQPPSVLELLLDQKSETEVKFQFTSFGRVHSMGSLVFKEDLAC
jgi:3-hydroxymyristoyl/3-hydroxydecanoyl-(acyl carrier protein) dehydratase